MIKPLVFIAFTFLLSLYVNCQSTKTAAQRFRDNIRNDSISQAYLKNLTDDPIDTVAIINEINTLTNDSLIETYWAKLYASDQDLHTLCEPAQSAINLLKCCYFFRKWGFKNWNACMYGSIIWGHNEFNDLSHIAVPVVKKCKNTHYNVSIPDSFFVQKLSPFKVNYHEALNDKYRTLKFDTIMKSVSYKEMVSLVNEVKSLSNKFHYVNPNEITKKYILGKWGAAVLKNREKSYQWMIFTYRNNYYLQRKGLFGFYKMTKENKSTFNFYTNYDGSYLEIMPNGNLSHKDKRGKVIEEYKKWGE